MPYGKKGGPEMKYGMGPKMGHSPAEMGHSPAEMESAKQERKNLMKDNPVAKTAAGQRPWISKHFKSSFNMNHSPAKMGHSPAEMGHSPAKMGHDSPAEKALVGKQKNLPEHLKKAIEAAPEMKYNSPAGKHCM